MYDNKNVYAYRKMGYFFGIGVLIKIKEKYQRIKQRLNSQKRTVRFIENEIIRNKNEHNINFITLK